MKIRVLIVGISQMFQAGIRTVLQNHRDFLVVGEVTNPSKAVEVAGVERPDVVLIDVDVLGGEIDKLINSLHKASSACFVLVLSDLKDEGLFLFTVSAAAEIYTLPYTTLFLSSRVSSWTTNRN